MVATPSTINQTKLTDLFSTGAKTMFSARLFAHGNAARRDALMCAHIRKTLQTKHGHNHPDPLYFDNWNRTRQHKTHKFAINNSIFPPI